MHYLLFYEFVPDYLDRRPQFRSAHLKLAWEAQARGDLVLAGAYCRGRLARARTADEREEAALDLQLGRIGWRHDDPTFRQVFASQFLPDGDRALWDAFNDLQRATTSTENVVRFLDVFAHIDVSALAPHVRCPTLILHARGDRRCPLPMGRAFYQALRANGVATQMVIYPGEGHGIRQPRHREDVLRRTLAWFRQHEGP